VHGGYGQRVLPVDEREELERDGAWRAHKRGAMFANPCYTQIHPTCIPVSGDHQSKLTLMSESLRNDGRVWVPLKAGRQAAAPDIPEGRARLLPRAPLPELRQPGAARHREPRGQGGVRRGARRRRDGARRVPRLRRLDQALGKKTIAERYGNLFEMYERITDENPYKLPMRIFRPCTTRWAASGWTTT
jgi:succinate dehydrogenase / fumarate reductase flavoprotein subunit